VNARSDQRLLWWWSRLKESDDWSSLKAPVKQEFVKRWQQCFIEMVDVYFTDKEIRDAMKATSTMDVFEALLDLWAIPERNRFNKFALKSIFLKNLKNRVLAQIQQRTYHTEPKQKRGKPASLELVESLRPYNFKSSACSICGEKIRKTNKTGICTTCQKQRKIKEERNGRARERTNEHGR